MFLRNIGYIFGIFLILDTVYTHLKKRGTGYGHRDSSNRTPRQRRERN
jgi:hypothetical protein